MGDEDVMQDMDDPLAESMLDSTADPLGYFQASTQQPSAPSIMAGTNLGAGIMSASPDVQFSWEMIGTGLDEPLPAEDVTNELCVLESR